MSQIWIDHRRWRASATCGIGVVKRARAMSTIIPRIYESYGSALDAATELKKNGYRDDEIALISNAPNREPGADEDAATAIRKAGIPAADVSPFADVVEQGKSLLVVRAVWGAAVRAIGIVGRHAPVDSAIGRREYYVPSRTGDNAKFSLTFGWPMLINDPSPFSSFWKWPLLSNNATPFSTMFSLSTLRSGYIFGTPKLIKDGALFSKELRIPVLLKK